MFVSIFYFLIINFSLINSTKYEIYISDGASEPYDGSKSHPFPLIYSAFSFTTANYISTANPLDEFHFKILPSSFNIPYFIKDDEITNGELFKNFYGNFISIIE